MSLDNFWHIAHATVAAFNCIAIENFVKLVASWEIFVTSSNNVFSTTMQLKSDTVAWIICQKSSRDIIKKSHQYHVTKDQNAIAEKKSEGNCQVNNVVYKCDVTRPLSKKVYLRLAEVEWKSRFYNHKLSFKHKRCSNKAKLSSYMWHLTLNLNWSVLRCIPPHWNIWKKYLLCLYEKLEIVTYQNQKELFNKRSELLCKCRHANRFLLKNYTGNDFR